ncbi:hypothetical protein ACOSP6_07275 [Tenacibaculum sp. MEBiC06402]|uniref:hypothetical protein n=1 Tax=unclassified Tenacibaculum TaxID=2635139 RepID=UPI003B9CF573
MKKIFFVSIFFLGLTLYSQSRFPITAKENCNRIRGKSWRACGLAVLNSNGKFICNVRTSSNRWQGFTGAIKFTFFTKNGQPVYIVQTPSYGVNGKSSRSDIFKTIVDKDMLEFIYSIKAEGIHTPSTRTIKQVTRTGATLLKAKLTKGASLTEGFKF